VVVPEEERRLGLAVTRDTAGAARRVSVEGHRTVAERDKVARERSMAMGASRIGQREDKLLYIYAWYRS